YQFITHSDTEVLLHGYHAWREQLPTKLTGMFAFAIADRRHHELFLARDRFGEKPLFISATSKYLAFASELRPLAALPDLERTLDMEALGGFLCLNYVPGTATLLKTIRRVPPASWQLYGQHGVIRSGTYWFPPSVTDAIPHQQSLEEATEEFRHRLDRAVSLCLRSDVPVGILLSGGIDSSLVAESAMRQGNLSRAYLVDFEEQSYSEFAKAKAVTEQLGLPLTRITVTAQTLLDNFFQIVDHADDPLADSSTLPVWAITQEAARYNKVVLGGDGGDELFAGYLTYLASRLHSRVITRFPMVIRKMLARIGANLPTTEGKVTLSYKLRRFLRAADLPVEQAHFSWNGSWLPEEAANLLRAESEITRHTLAKIASRLNLTDKHNLLGLQQADLAEYLPNDILTKTDRMSMAHGLETRAPFLEHELAEWALQRPDWQKISGKTLKVIPRTAARQLFGKLIADSPKQGFSIPVHQWIRGPLAEMIQDLLSPDSLDKLEFLNSEAVHKVVIDHFSGRRSYGFELWGLSVLVAWYRVRIAQSPQPPSQSRLIQR
ncbi:MAG: asparagine synthase (glutamine-hydrolyzing), partial [Thiotrichaceae bacterium IS1]